MYNISYTGHTVVDDHATRVLMIRIRTDSGLVPFPSTKKGLQGHTSVKRNLEQSTTGSHKKSMEMAVTCSHFGSFWNVED